jgi:chromosomal replication initiation ATPase DnaA
MEFPLDPTQTFESFVVGSGNRLAASAALRSAESPGTICNPLVIHGPTGLGKTHLLHAIGNRACAVQNRLRVMYAPLEAFVARLTSAMAASGLESFRKEYLGIDVLLLDDVQFLEGKVRLQQELLPVWDSMGRNGAQIVLASDRAPTEIDRLDMRLTARFARGLVVDIAVPDQETRVAIVRAMADARGDRLHDGVAEELARLVSSSVREMEQSLERLLRVQQREGTAIVGPEVAPLLGISDVAPPREVVRMTPERATPDNPFRSFLTDIAAVVEEVVDAAPWRQQLAEAILYWGGEGLRTWRLEAALEGESGEEIEVLISRFAEEAARLREISDELARLGTPAASSPALRDPERLAEAEALLLGAQMDAAPLGAAPAELTLDAFAPAGAEPPAAVILARQVIAGHDSAQNPFFVAGPAERTLHLVAGVSNEIRASRPGARLAFASGAALAEELAAALEHGYLDSWRQRYRRVDLFSVDGIEPLLEVPETADAFRGMLENLLRDGTQVVLSAGATPRRIPDLDPRLLSRLEGGLVLDLVAMAPRRASGFRSSAAASVGSGGPDRWFLNREKLAWDWVALSDRIIEELG